MAELASMYVRIGAKMDDLEKGLSGVRGKLASLGSTLTNLGGKLTLAVSAPLLLIGKAAIQSAADMEQTRVAFETLTGSASTAAKVLDDVRKFAAATPFEFPELADATRKLIAFGISADDSVETLRRIGDVASGVSAPIGEIAEIYGKARVQGRLFAEDVNQFTGRGIPIIQELAKQFGVAESGVRKLVEEGKVGFPALEKAFVDLTSEGGKFAGMMDKQSQTLSGRLSTLRDNIGELARSIAETMMPELKAAAEFVLRLVSRFSEMDDGTKKVVATLAALAAGIPIVITGVGLLATALAGLTIKMALITGGVTIIIGSLALLALNWRTVSTQIQQYWAEATAFVASKGANIVEAVGGVSTALRGLLMALGVTLPPDSVLDQIKDRLRQIAFEAAQTASSIEYFKRLEGTGGTAGRTGKPKFGAAPTGRPAGNEVQVGSPINMELAKTRLKDDAAEIENILGNLTRDADDFIDTLQEKLDTEIQGPRVLQGMRLDYLSTEIEKELERATLASDDFMQGFEEGMGESTAGAIEHIQGVRTSIVDVGASITSNLIGAMSSFTSVAEQGFTKLFEALAEGKRGVFTLANAWKVMAASALSAVADVIRAIRDQMVATFSAQAAAFALAGAWGKAARAAAAAIAVGTSLSLAAAGVQSMANRKIDQIPQMASGGIVKRPTIAMIGERGPEAVVPLSRMSQQPVQPVLRVGIGELYVELDRYARENGLQLGRV